MTTGRIQASTVTPVDTAGNPSTAAVPVPSKVMPRRITPFSNPVLPERSGPTSASRSSSPRHHPRMSAGWTTHPGMVTVTDSAGSSPLPTTADAAASSDSDTATAWALRRVVRPPSAAGHRMGEMVAATRDDDQGIWRASLALHHGNTCSGAHCTAMAVSTSSGSTWASPSTENTTVCSAPVNAWPAAGSSDTG